ncbi:hypothetical protein SCUCBS95973_001783 [Sporothrix curviconia]|uniref:Uncharacterized protein n=1 Tax=Sporothrix curviconia TaxID=1260050 RepID=A0ABP0B1N8_9PEZI
MIKEESSHDEMHLADDNPLIYFLTPTLPLLSVDEDGESYFIDDSDSSSYFNDNDNDNGMDDDSAFYSSAMDFEFDAGIEDATQPQPVVRSVSPSSLAESIGTHGRISRIPLRPPTPPRVSMDSSLHPNRPHPIGSAAIDDDGEDYIHFGGASQTSWPIPSAKGKSTHISPSPLSSSPASPRSASDNHDLYALYHSNSSASHLTAAGAMIVRRRSPRSWRVPSPEVFSIEEETEEELSTGVAAAKPPQKKKVRFILPGEEVA